MMLGRFLHQSGWHEHRYHQTAPQPRETEQAPPPAPAPPPPSAAETLTKYGYPVPHKLVGPYHVLVNQGYVSGYDAGIQDPRWVETRFFAVANPTSAGRPGEFSTDDRIEPEYQVNTHYWTDSGYDRGHMFGTCSVLDKSDGVYIVFLSIRSDARASTNRALRRRRWFDGKLGVFYRCGGGR